MNILKLVLSFPFLALGLFFIWVASLFHKTDITPGSAEFEDESFPDYKKVRESWL